MGYDDITEKLHKEYCLFLGADSQRKQATMPRSFVKSWIGSIAYACWISLPRTQEKEFPYEKAWEDKYWKLGPDIRILIASYVITNAEKMISLIRKTYESNSAMQMLFPEVIPENFTKTRWSNESACISRPNNFTESTFEAAGIGGASISRHYDLIIEDDLVYAKKDDLTGRELQPDMQDIEQAIGWHKLAHSLLVPGKHTHIHNIGTRWARNDLVEYIWKNEPSYSRFIKGCVNLDELAQGKHWSECTPEWKECYDVPQLQKIRDAQGAYMFSTQYLLNPMSVEELLFKRHYLQEYTTDTQVPKAIRNFTTVDLAEWGTSTRKRGDCNAVVLTCSWDSNSHLWIRHYDVGRFDPTEVIILMAKHWKLYSPEFIGVEGIYYQKSLAHFARKAMEVGYVLDKKGKKVPIPMMSIRNITPEGNESKELRIRALEPYASNLVIHCKPSHTEFINEFVEYVPNSQSCKKDILDALAYQLQVARPGIPTKETREKPLGDDLVFETKIEEVLDQAWGKNKKRDIFGNQAPTTSPFIEEEANILEYALDPFYIEEDYFGS